MNNKTKIITSLSFVLVLSFVLAVSASASSPTSSFMKEWGRILKENAYDMPQESTYALGKNTVITNKDIDQVAKFYMLSGLDEQSAREEAIEYVMQREALYHAAIENGYSVTDEEVWAYIEELKRVIDSADNREDAMAVMSQFDSEEDYWNYEFMVYQKNLPIQNYVYDLEQAFNQVSVYSDETTDGDDSGWQQYFEQIKEDLVSDEGYQIVTQ